MASMTVAEFDAEYQGLFRELTRLGWALGLGGDSEDAAQEVLLDGRRRISQLRDRSALRAWLRRMMIRAASKRWARPRHGHLDPSLSYLPADRTGDIDIGDAVKRLPPRQRLAVALVYGLGYSQAEAAAAMGITRGGVGKALYDARARLVIQLRKGRVSGEG